MEEIYKIKIEIEEKKGKEWIGLAQSTERQLEALLLYMDHPKLKEKPKLMNEIVELYYIAKESAFIKMESIIRKLDQLNIMFGDALSIKKEGVSEFVNTAQEIKRFITKIENFKTTSSWMSLPIGTQDSIDSFLGNLKHPKLQEKPGLVEEMLKTYNSAEAEDYIKMQTFKAMLNKIEIKLGPVPIEEVKEDIIEEEKEVDVCNNCGNENRIIAKFCDKCGFSLIDAEYLRKEPYICKRCGNENRVDAKFCDNCGVSLTIEEVVKEVVEEEKEKQVAVQIIEEDDITRIIEANKDEQVAVLITEEEPSQAEEVEQEEKTVIDEIPKDEDATENDDEFPKE